MSDTARAGLLSGKTQPSIASTSSPIFDANLPTSISSSSLPCDKADSKSSGSKEEALSWEQGNHESSRLSDSEQPSCVNLRPLDFSQDDTIAGVSEAGTETYWTGKRRRKRSRIGQKFSQPPVTALHLLKISMSINRLFIASLGNPPPYSSTRHSAGHVLLKALQNYLQFPPFQKSKTYANGLVSVGADVGRPGFTLWQSPSLMNVSGVALLKAYKTFASTAQMSVNDPMPGLVVLYDEMETVPSQLKLRRGATSAKGHNGLKSVQQSLQSAGLMNHLGDRFVKIGIGIGRPAGGSRSSEDVSKYVLAQFSNSERQAIDDRVTELVQMLEAETMRFGE